MKVTYRVIDKRTGEDITDNYCWVLQPNGKLSYNEYGDLIGMTYAEAVISVSDDSSPSFVKIQRTNFKGE